MVSLCAGSLLSALKQEPVFAAVVAVLCAGPRVVFVMLRMSMGELYASEILALIDVE